MEAILAQALSTSSASATASATATATATATASATASATATAAASESALPIIPTISPDTSPQDLGNAFNKWVSETFSLGIWGTIIYTGIVALIAFLILKLMQRTIRKKLYGNLRIFYNLLRVIVVTVAVFSVLLTITPLKELGNAVVASSGIASVIVGLAAQKTLANLFSGLSIAIAKPFIVGDYIEIMGTSPAIMGTVTKITFRSTVIRDASNKDIVVPNSVIDQDIIRTSAASTSGPETAAGHQPPAQPITNFLEVGVAYTADVKKAMQIMADLVEKQPAFVDTRTDKEKQDGVPAVTVRVMDLAASSVNLRALVPTRTVSEGFAVLSDLRLLVLNTFNEEGIEIPYPYENVILQQQESQHAAATRPIANSQAQKAGQKKKRPKQTAGKTS